MSDTLQNQDELASVSIQKQAEDYLDIMTRRCRVLPCIKDLQKKTQRITNLKPAAGVSPQREELPCASAGEKHKNALTMRLLRNPAHPHNRAVMHQKCGISLPDVHKRSTNAAHQKIITGPVVTNQANQDSEDMRTVPHTSSLHISVQAALLHPKLDSYSSKKGSKSRSHKQLKCETETASTGEKVSRDCTPLLTPKTPPPTTTSKSMDGMMEDSDGLISGSPPNRLLLVPVNISKYPFTLINGQLNPLATDFCHFKQSFSFCWSSVVDPLESLVKLLRDFAVPRAKVRGEELVRFGHSWNAGLKKAPPVMGLLSVLENGEEVSRLISRPGQRYKGVGGVVAAAIHIQSCWRRYLVRKVYFGLKWAARIIAFSWSMHIQMRRARKALQARRFRQLESYRSRAKHLAANWKHIQSSKRTIIHIPSLGYSLSQRRNLERFDILQNIQISRLCDIRDENVDVIYVCPRHLQEDILHYYTSLLKCDEGADGARSGPSLASSRVRRFVIITPEAVDYFPTHNMCLSTLLKYSPRTLKRIKNLVQGKQAYIVGGVAHVDDLIVADELGVPVLGPEPAIAQLYSSKSGVRRIFAAAEVEMVPGHRDIYTLNQLHEALAELMSQNMDVQRWLFKINSEHGGRGTAYCDVSHLSCYNWALQQYRRYAPELWNATWMQESVMLRYLHGVPEWLTRYARPANTSHYPNWACFLKTFLGQGGVVEAYPPSDSVTCLTVDLLLEPGGEVTMLSCGDQLHGSCQLETLGSTVPQSSVDPETLHSICMRVGQACLQRLIVGYVSVDLATFLNHSTMEQKVWTIDLDLTYSDQLAMTQMLLMMTGGTLNCRASCLEVPVGEKCCQHQIAAKLPVVNCHAVIGSRLFHSNLSMLYHRVFLKLCKAHDIGFHTKKKHGTVFAIYDGIERRHIGMITVSGDLQGALVTFARNLSVIHQEISPSETQGETNFKELIKDIEDVLQMTAQNKMRAVEDKPAA